MGRSLIADEAVDAMVSVAEGYSNLEYGLEAVAVMLTLSALAKGREVVVSRGELVEMAGHSESPRLWS